MMPIRSSLFWVWRPMRQKDYELSELMTDYLCNFARNGNPNGADLPEWTAADGHKRNAMIIGENAPGMRKPGMLKMIVTMLTNKAVGE